MSYKQNVEDNLEHFAKSIGLGDLKLNEHNACGLCFDETMSVNMEYLEDDARLVFISSVKKVDVHDDALEKLFQTSLAFNLQHHSMQGAYLALSNDQTELLLMKSNLASNDYGNFETSLEKYVNTLEWIIKELSDLKSDQIPNQPKENSYKKRIDEQNMGIMV